MSKSIGNCANCKIRHLLGMNFIEFCPLHRAASELLDAAENLVKRHDAQAIARGFRTCGCTDCGQMKAAIANEKAKDE